MIALKPLVSTWFTAIKASERSRSEWFNTAQVCRQFFSGAVGFMWTKEFRAKHLKNLPDSKFEITIAKCFEYVSITLPQLMWNYPGRYNTSFEGMDIPTEFWDSEEEAAEWMQESSQEKAINEARAQLMGRYQNYTPKEQPGGGLKVDSHMALVDSMISGRGVVRVDPYQTGNGKTLTGAFYVDPEDLFIDPDCTRANLSNAKWIAIRHVDAHWELERRFGWPAGSLANKATRTGKISAVAASSSPISGSEAARKDAQDNVVWYEVFSKMGIGTRFKNCAKMEDWKDAFEELGDNTYLCLVSGLDEPLNLRTSFLESAEVEQVKAAVDWPTPYYKDGRWPVAILDYWLQPRKAWPLAPLAMGLGELIFLNVFISSLADKTFQDCLVKAAIRQEVGEDAVKKLLSYSNEVIQLNPAIAQNINEMVSYLQRPQTNYDGFKMVEFISEMFDKRIGLMESQYGLGTVPRSATDSDNKNKAVGARADYMHGQVEAWQTEIANLERITAGYHVDGETLIPLLGRKGAELWTRLITEANEEAYMLEMRSHVEAGSMRKPDREKAAANMQQLGAITLPVVQWYAQTTGNTEPLNAFMKSMGKAIDQPVDTWALPPVPQSQGPSPEEQAMQQLTQQKIQGDVQGRDLKNKKMVHEMMAGGQGLPVEMLAEANLDTSPEGAM